MHTYPVVFVAFEEFDNLGVGYLSSVLSDAGYESSVIDFTDKKEDILQKLRKRKPLIVGFSVIFQNHIYEFEELIRYLRKGGITSHFTAGGQYASLKYEDLFEMIPALDSIVRFEGEYTFLELVNCINSGTDWKNTAGIVYQNNGIIILNALRPVETDLDKFPLPMRSLLKEYALNKKFATILAGRGCLNNCSFCYLKEYYKQSSGPYKRIRKPEKVVWEMELLHNEMDCSVFLFQDDDFPVKPNNSTEWIEKFCKKLRSKKLNDKIMWKINCRPDEIDYDSFALMKKNGLFLVFLGIEDGTDTGLIRIRKNISVSKILEGINILKMLEIGFDYGFMLFQPSSTFRSVNDNLDFLREICSDGFSSVTFLKMMPYCATPVEKELGNQGRLKGKPGFFDYDFFDESLNHYYEFTADCFMEWLLDSDGLLNLSKWARNYISVYSHYYEFTEDISLISKNIKSIISESNLFILDTMKELIPIFESGKFNNGNNKSLKGYKKNITLKHQQYSEKVRNNIINLVAHFELQKMTQSVFI
ncbi:MAG: radical SAM protein [Bacteroidota bacterium]